MIIDANALPQGHLQETDVCILGGGVAGLTVARELAGLNLEVCILEQGGMEEEAEAQRLHRGEVEGYPNAYPYWSLDDARHAQVGGCGNRWHVKLNDGRQGARFRPLDPIDFERRDGVPHSGWPFSKTELDPYYERAQRHLHLGPYTYDPAEWLREEDFLLFEDAPSLETILFQYGPRDRFLDGHREVVREAKNIVVLCHAHATSLETAPNGGSVTEVQGRTLEGAAFTVRANTYVLALGGIENARLLLVSTQGQARGIGNDHDLVGRYFMEHPHLHAGLLWPSDPSVFYGTDRFYHAHECGGTSIHGKLALNEAVLRREHLRNSCFMLLPYADPSELIQAKALDAAREFQSTSRRGYLPDRSLSKLGTIIANSGAVFKYTGRELSNRLSKWGRTSHVPPVVYMLHHFAEQAPNPNSRVRLSERQKDQFGQPRARLEWKISPDDIRDLMRGLEILKPEIERSGEWELDIPEYESVPPPGIRGGYHHMGTTRMHQSPTQGVVDPQSRVHGVANLFVTGSSVFPTSGYANPTLTIVALAIRLADHLKHTHRSGTNTHQTYPSKTLRQSESSPADRVSVEE